MAVLSHAEVKARLCAALLRATARPIVTTEQLADAVMDEFASIGYLVPVEVPRERPLADVLREASGNGGSPAPVPAEKVWTIEEYEARLNSTREATYRYTNPATRALDLIVFRWRDREGHKHFTQGRAAPGGVVLKAPAKPWPLYNRTRLLTANPIIVVEGEKCVHALQDLGIVATTSPGGASNAQHADWSPLAGKTLYLWPDNDDAGAKYMDTVTEAARGIAGATILRVDPADTGVGEKGDAADFLAAMGGASRDEKRLAVQNVLADAVSCGVASEVMGRLEDMIAGRYRAVPLPWPMLSRATRALLPGTVTVLCGDPGATKSIMLLQAMAHWHESGIPIAFYEMEEDRVYHLNRLVAQRVGDSNLTDPEWIERNPDLAREAFQSCQAEIDTIGRDMAEAPDSQKTLTELAEWVGRQALAGKRVIAIDPITAAAQGSKPWIEDLEFLLAVKTHMRTHGASLVLVTHPRPGAKKAGLDNMAGGRAYARFTQTVLWVRGLHPPQTKNIKTQLGPTMIEVNRIVRVSKARNSFGSGMDFGFEFDGRTLRIKEHGLIEEGAK